MKKALLGALFLAVGAIAAAPPAQAQYYGHGGPGYGDYRSHPRAWARQAEWQDRMERRARREYWRERREIMERRAYEAGRRDAHAQQWHGGWR